MPDEAWRERLKRDVPRAEIPLFLTELQRLVAALRAWRDDLKVPGPQDVAPFLTPALRAHAPLTLGYLDDPRYASVVEAALQDADAADASVQQENT